jgi:hypothetical protein
VLKHTLGISSRKIFEKDFGVYRIMGELELWWSKAIGSQHCISRSLTMAAATLTDAIATSSLHISTANSERPEDMY